MWDPKKLLISWMDTFKVRLVENLFVQSVMTYSMYCLLKEKMLWMLKNWCYYMTKKNIVLGGKKGSGLLFISKRPLKKPILHIWNNDPHPCAALLCIPVTKKDIGMCWCHLICGWAVSNRNWNILFMHNTGMHMTSKMETILLDTDY